MNGEIDARQIGVRMLSGIKSDLDDLAVAFIVIDVLMLLGRP
ncbi:MAG TPA: hypothetical protein PLP07_01650 [Pyrinomonadaceae bacterium]|nr:hypothetical protein [Pyrinomonadaceae bacterium]HQY66160.1 hypothetical protein [Pyrinomonadaceae bacterium]HRA41394.1 hypothetical protein [Pyrinomonadaceae bacterium]